MKLGFSQQEIIGTAKTLGLPTDGFIQRRVARAYDLVNTNKVSEVTDGIFRVRSQYEPDKAYIVNLNHGEPSCDCPDGERTINCKHRIAALLYAQKQVQPQMLTVYDDTKNSYHGRGRWIVTDTKRRAKYIVYREKNGRLICPCPSGRGDCEHKKAIKDYEDGKETKIVDEFHQSICGTKRAEAIQEKLNGQLTKSENSGNGAEKAPSQTMSLDLRDPFQQSEQLDIDQIEGRLNGELVHKLSNGEYVISYKGIMSLSQKHGIEFSSGFNSLTSQVIARARLNGNERVSGKLPIPNKETAIELAKRNAARQLLPLPEIKAVEKKAQLEAEFDWQKAHAKCLRLVPAHNLSVLIYDLTQAGKLREDNPSHYNRTEWLMIYDYCQKDAKVQAEIDPEGKSLNRWSYNSVVFLEEVQKRLDAVRAEKQAEANDMPLQTEGKRKVQMDKKLRTWLIETDGTKKQISCREICEQFETKQNPNLVPRLRAGIDSGADLSTVELT